MTKAELAGTIRTKFFLSGLFTGDHALEKAVAIALQWYQEVIEVEFPNDKR